MKKVATVLLLVLILSVAALPVYAQGADDVGTSGSIKVDTSPGTSPMPGKYGGPIICTKSSAVQNADGDAVIHPLAPIGCAEPIKIDF